MQGQTRNRKLVALATATYCASSDGRRPGRGFQEPTIPHKKLPPVAIYAKMEIAGEEVFAPTNAQAARDFEKLSDNEKIAFLTQPHVTPRTEPRECESTRILAGSRFKALPRGKREGDVFVGDKIRPLYPNYTGSMEDVHTLHRASGSMFEARRPAGPIVSRLMTEHSLTREEAEATYKLYLNDKSP